MHPTPQLGARGPGIAVVADASQWQRLRHLIYSIRETSRCTADIYVLNIGLTPAQEQCLRLADLRVVRVSRAERDAIPMPAPFMWKCFADRLCPKADPLIVCDADIEFRDPAVLAELFEVAKTRIFIAEEIYGWVSNVNVTYELKGIHAVKQAFIDSQAHLLQDYPIVNAGLFGGPRGIFDQFMTLARMISAGILDVYHWFWEQIAFSLLVRMGLFPVEILSTEHNWITHWGTNPKARIYHFSGGMPGCLGSELRRVIPRGYLYVKPEPSCWRTIKGYRNVQVQMLGRVEAPKGETSKRRNVETSKRRKRRPLCGPPEVADS